MTIFEAGLRWKKGSRRVSREKGEESSQASWVKRAHQGDGEAFDHLMAIHQQRVFGTARRLLGSTEEAQDAVQEVFLRFFRHLHRFQAGRPLAPWLYRLTVNVCHDLIDRRRRRRTLSLESMQEEQGLEVPDLRANPEQRSDLRQEARHVEDALARLPYKERTALVLRDIEGLSTSQVATILESSPSTVRSQICRARLHLKTLLERQRKGVSP